MLVSNQSSVNEGVFRLEKTVADYVYLYRSNSRKSVEAFLTLAQTLAEASEHLDHDDLSTFCQEIGIRKGGATYSKHLTIARSIERFRDRIDSLPACWTTLYALAKLGDDQFSDVEPHLGPNITARFINHRSAKPAKISIETQEPMNDDLGPDVQIFLTGMSIMDKFEVRRQLEAMQARFGFELVTTLSLSAINFDNEILEAA